MEYRFSLSKCSLAIVCACQFSAFAEEQSTSDEVIEVQGRQTNLIGEAVSASQGIVGQQEIEIRPLLRTGEVLELVPGMVVTQHSGTGKANQYFLRGFNLDHGTDFASFVDFMPVNMRTHGHGQGYSDLNFVIPELVSSISYKKGPYYAEIGDFSGAGSATMHYADKLERGRFDVTVGQNNYLRTLLLDSVAFAGGDWIYAIERNTFDGQWSDINEDLDKTNAVLKHHRMLAGGQLSLTLMAYDNSWNSADQIPQRAVEQNTIDLFGSIDPSVGGQSSRNSISAQWRDEQWQVAAYAIDYDINLWGNFTYYLEDSVNGDQHEQVDNRWIYGANLSYLTHSQLAGKPMTNSFGAEFRYDDIDEVALYKARKRQRIGNIRSDKVKQASIGLYWENQLELNDELTSTFALRYDYHGFEVASHHDLNVHGVHLTDNGGTADDGLFSAKYSLGYQLNDSIEVYGSVGQGFHSNDARGTTIAVDATDASPLESVPPLVRSFGGEFGVRGFVQETLNLSAALWYLKLDSELIFVGDAGNTEPSGKSERQGLEVTAYYQLNQHWTFDFELALSDAKYSDADAGLDKVPGAIDKVLQMGVSADFESGLFGSLRLRYFGERPLVESGEVSSDSSTVVNLRTGYRWQNWSMTLDVLNLLDSDDHDIDYYYASRLAGESAEVEDIHFHPFEPRTARLTVSYQF